MLVHPCKLNHVSNPTHCLYCHKRAVSGWYCNTCELYFCSSCHETLQSQAIPNFIWREELSFHRDQYLKQLDDRQRALQDCLPLLPDLYAIVSSYSYLEPVVSILLVSGGTYWFRFGEESTRRVEWIYFDEPGRTYFGEIIQKASLGKIKRILDRRTNMTGDF